jgi:uncharacterized oligopeptide transporter (OPT) family protein
MTAGATSGAAASSADLLTDLKSGYLLGANPRKQFIAQYLGIFAGCLVIVPAFYILVPTPESRGDKRAAPSALVWAAVAKLLAEGLGALHITARYGMLIGGAAGILLALAEMKLPKKLSQWIPSPTGVGLAMVIPFQNSFSMFIGASVACILQKSLPRLSDRYLIPICSGLIAGESLLGVLIALLESMKVL